MRNARIALLASVAPMLLAAPAVAGAQSRIVGGSAASAGEYPAQAFLRIDRGAGFVSCGGTLIARTKVATAAHCLMAASALPIFSGPGPVPADAVTVFLGSNTAGAGDEQVAAAVAIHPDYDPSSSANDIAVITLPEPATQAPLGIIDPTIDAAAYAVGQPATVIGWGTTSSGGAASATLLEVEVPVVSDENCNDANSYGGALVTQVMLCAGLPTGGKDACQGDSGGPLMVSSAGALKLVGIVSFGDGCARPEKYGVYTEIPAPGIRAFLVAEAGAPPTVTIGDATGVVAGSATTLRATATDPTSGGGIATVTWDLDADGVFDDATGVQPSWTPADAGDRPVRVRVTDTDGMVAVNQRTVTVAAAGGTTGGPTETTTPSGGAATPPTAAPPLATPAVPATTSPATRVRARLTRVSAQGARGTLRVRGTVAGDPCTSGRVRVTVTRGGRRVGRKVATVGSSCTFSTSVRTRGRLKVSIEFLATDGSVTKLATRTRRVR